MTTIEETIDVRVPLHTAYNQWTQFEDFPRFMEGVKQVQQLNETTLEWRAMVAGVEKTWRARIVEQVPDQRITWVSTDGARNDGTVSFGSVGADTTRVKLLLEVEPEGPVEEAGTALGLVRQRVRGDLERFRDFVEARGSASGGWRGEVHAGQEVTSSGTASPDPGWPGMPAPAGAGTSGKVERTSTETADIPGLHSTTRTRA